MPAEVLDQVMSNKRFYNIILQNYPSLLALRSSSEQKLNESAPEASKSKPVTMSMKFKLNKKKEKERKKEFENKLDVVREKLLQPIPENKPAIIAPRQDWWARQLHTDHHYLRGIRVHRNSIMHRGAMMNIAKYKLRASSCPDIYRNSMWSVEEEKVIIFNKTLAVFSILMIHYDPFYATLKLFEQKKIGMSQCVHSSTRILYRNCLSSSSMLTFLIIQKSC